MTVDLNNCFIQMNGEMEMKHNTSITMSECSAKSSTTLQDMHKRLLSLIEERRVKMSQGTFNCVSLFNPSGRILLDSKKAEFDKLYSTLFKVYSYGFAELQGAYTSIIVDIDIKQTYTPSGASSDMSSGINNTIDIKFLDSKLYTDEQVAAVVELYQRQIREVLYDSSDETCIKETNEYFKGEAYDSSYLANAPIPDLTAFVLEKPHDYVQNGHRKSGFHIHFPGIIMSAQNINSFIYSQLTDTIQALIPNSTHDNILSKPILMYGSRKTENMEYYRLTRVFQGDGTEVSPECYFKCADYEVGLPRFFSVNVANKRTCVIKPYVEVKVKVNRDVEATRMQAAADDNMLYDFDDCYEEISALVSMLSDDRATNHDQWMEVGWMLWNIGNGCAEAYDLWVQFSKRTKDLAKFDVAVCAYEWSRMRKGKYTIKSLRYFASVDSPERYKTYKRKNIKSQYISNLRDTDTDFAEMLARMYSDSYKCANIERDEWYYFKNHRWHTMNGACELRARIDKEIKDMYIAFMREINMKRNIINKRIAGQPINIDDAQSDDDDDFMAEVMDKSNDELIAELEGSDEQYKKAAAIVQSLGSCSKKNNIVKESRYKFYDDKFAEFVDEDPMLLCFENGVFDFRQMLFRDGQPMDYITKCTKYKYKPLDKFDEFAMNEIHDFKQKLYPDDLLRECMWQIYASALTGGNPDKAYVIHSGIMGNNGKSQMQHLLTQAFGEYSINLPTSLVTGKRTASSGCTPELSRAPGTRIAFLQEPDSADTFQCGIVKELTGNDKMYTRGLFKEGRDTNIKFKPHMICNLPPKVNTTDPAFWNRIKVVPYESVFVPRKLCPESADEQRKTKVFQDDVHISARLTELKSVFMSMLIEKYKDLASGKCTKLRAEDVPKIRDATKAYRISSDFIGRFLDAHYVIDPNIPDRLSLEEMFRNYKIYLNDIGFSAKPNHGEFSHYVSTRTKIVRMNTVLCIRKKDESDLDNDALIMATDDE